MKILFRDELFDSQLLRAMNHVYYGGADVGECMSTAHRITEPDPDSWHKEWMQTADRVYRSGESSLKQGRFVSAREAFLRASNYYRTAYIFLIKPEVDLRVVEAYDRQTRAFRQAAALFSPPIETVEILYENTTLPGYFLKSDDSGERRPTMILTGGYDGTAEELYFFSAAAALRRGYNCLCFDGPRTGERIDQTRAALPA